MDKYEDFESSDSQYYAGDYFRLVVIRKNFGEMVHRKLINILKIPPDLQQHDIDLENLEKQILTKIQTRVNAKKIAEPTSPEGRYARCLKFASVVTLRAALAFVAKKGRPWDHGDFDQEVLGYYKENSHIRRVSGKAQGWVSTGGVSDEEAKIRLHDAVCPPISEADFEIFWLKAVDKRPYCEIGEQFPQFSLNNLRVIKHKTKRRIRLILRNSTSLKDLMEDDENEQE